MSYINQISSETESMGGLNYPCIKITNINGDVGYLLPFRFYKFQVCGTKTGEWDLGSGDVHFFKLYFEKHKYDYNICAAVIDELYKAATACLTSYLDTSYGYPGKKVAVRYGGTPYFTEYQLKKGYPDKVVDYFDIEDIEGIDDFLCDTYKLVVDYYKLNVA
jgi:hypothetical protein